MTSDEGHTLDEADHTPQRPRWSRRAVSIFVTVVLVVLALIVLSFLRILDLPSGWQSISKWWVTGGWPWISKWLISPGFGGVAAVVAASLAFAGSRHQARLNAWWQRVEWALNLYVKPEATDPERQAGVAALEALQKSSLAKRDERIFLGEVVTGVTLDPDGDGDEVDDMQGEEPSNSPPVDSGATAPRAARRGSLWTKLRRMRDTWSTRGRTGGSA